MRSRSSAVAPAMLFQLEAPGVQRRGLDTLLLRMKHLSSLGLMPFTSPLGCHLFPFRFCLSAALSVPTANVLYIKQIVNAMPSPTVNAITHRPGLLYDPVHCRSEHIRQTFSVSLCFFTHGQFLFFLQSDIGQMYVCFFRFLCVWLCICLPCDSFCGLTLVVLNCNRSSSPLL